MSDKIIHENSSTYAQGNPCAGKQGSCPRKAIQVAEKLRTMKLTKAAKKVANGIEEALTYMDFPTQHWA